MGQFDKFGVQRHSSNSREDRPHKRNIPLLIIQALVLFSVLKLYERHSYQTLQTQPLDTDRSATLTESIEDDPKNPLNNPLMNRPIPSNNEEDSASRSTTVTTDAPRIDGEENTNGDYSSTNSNPKCSHVSIKKPEPQAMEPTMVTSYPGSGSKLTWKLIRALTGVMTGDDVDHNGLVSKGEVITVKTHYPVVGEELFPSFENVPRSVILLRSPIYAIPSYFNFQYEQENNLVNHSTRAPINKWVKYRDDHFEEQLQLWIDHVKFWMEHHQYEHRLIITYEDIIGPETGPDTALRLGDFLVGSSQLAHPIEDISCVWDMVLNERIYKGTRMPSKRQGGPTIFPYKKIQKQKVYDELNALRELYPGQLGPILDRYLSDISRMLQQYHR